MRVAVIGAGWAGCTAAVEALRHGHQVTLYDSARTAGGRARRVNGSLHGNAIALDNGQHILIGAYSATLRLMRELGIDPDAALLRLPLTLLTPDGHGLQLPDWPAPLDAIAGILRARGWRWADKWSLLQVATRWQLAGFQCDAAVSVSRLCQGLSPAAMQGLIEPLCVSALNTPAHQASGQVFLRVMKDAMFSASGGSNLLLPRVDLGALLPDAALACIAGRGGSVRLGDRVRSLHRQAGPDGCWAVIAGDEVVVDAVVLACPPQEAARLVDSAASMQTKASASETSSTPTRPGEWARLARELRHEALTTVYAHAPDARLARPMLALASSREEPAQFVFDRGQLDGPPGLLAFVISASDGEGAALTWQVLAQASRQLGLDDLTPVQTIVEKRATFACTPGLVRPGPDIAPGLLACGDYIAGPYPATLEGAVRSGIDAAQRLGR